MYLILEEKSGDNTLSKVLTVFKTRILSSIVDKSLRYILQLQI